MRLLLAAVLVLVALTTVGCDKDPVRPRMGEPDAPGASADTTCHEHDRGKGHGKH